MNIMHRASLLGLVLAAALGLPTAQAAERSWSYTYNNQSLVETVNGPRTDDNDVTTTLAYTPQGWLASVSMAGSTTGFEYDAIDQITKVTRGDGSWLQYNWSGARRLTGITNNLGESVEYDYDLMSNRIAQRLKDPPAT